MMQWVQKISFEVPVYTFIIEGIYDWFLITRLL